jgi:hypothetical protein
MPGHSAEYSDSPITKVKVKPGKFARSPWAMGVKHPSRDQQLTHNLYAWIETTTSPELERYALHISEHLLHLYQHLSSNFIFANTKNHVFPIMAGHGLFTITHDTLRSKVLL